MKVFDPESEVFLNVEIIRPLMDLVECPLSSQLRRVHCSEAVLREHDKLSYGEHSTLISLLLQDILKDMLSSFSYETFSDSDV